VGIEEGWACVEAILEGADKRTRHGRQRRSWCPRRRAEDGMVTGGAGDTGDAGGGSDEGVEGDMTRSDKIL
jgi:hypothetical protein